MRELKFRAWDETISKMKYEDESIEVYQISYWRKYDFYKVMQYTGLKDKNGKEIYEGDVLYNHEYQQKIKVIWKNYQEDEDGWLKEKGSWGFRQLDDRPLKAIFIKSLEVIGNIYENPEF